MAENRSHKLEVEGSSPSAPISEKLTDFTASIDLKSLYWLAGLLEAEGSFLRPPPSSLNTIGISIAMTDEDVVSRVAQIFAVKLQKWQPKNLNHKMNYMAILRGHRAAELMVRLYPLMSERRQGQIDRALKDYTYKPNQKGENAGFVKLTEAQVRDIKQRLANGETQKYIAQIFNISKRTISDINCGKTWSHIHIDS